MTAVSWPKRIRREEYGTEGKIVVVGARTCETRQEEHSQILCAGRPPIQAPATRAAQDGSQSGGAAPAHAHPRGAHRGSRRRRLRRHQHQAGRRTRRRLAARLLRTVRQQGGVLPGDVRSDRAARPQADQRRLPRLPWGARAARGGSLPALRAEHRRRTQRHRAGGRGGAALQPRRRHARAPRHGRLRADARAQLRRSAQLEAAAHAHRQGDRRRPARHRRVVPQRAPRRHAGRPRRRDAPLDAAVPDIPGRAPRRAHGRPTQHAHARDLIHLRPRPGRRRTTGARRAHASAAGHPAAGHPRGTAQPQRPADRRRGQRGSGGLLRAVRRQGPVLPGGARGHLRRSCSRSPPTPSSSAATGRVPYAACSAS